jgi:hypothetical protein
LRNKKAIKEYKKIWDETSNCFDDKNQRIKDCDCDETCKTCGYNGNPTSNKDCIDCETGRTLNSIYKDGTGKCVKDRDIANDFWYKCTSGESYATYNSNTLTPSQKKKARDTYGAREPTYYACNQGCKGECKKQTHGIMKDV